MKNLLKDTKINTKIFFLLGLALTLMSLVTMIGLWQVNKIGKEIMTLTKLNIPLKKVLSRITFNSMGQRIHFERAVEHSMGMAQNATARNNFEIEREKFLKSGQTTIQEVAKGKELLEQLLAVYRTSQNQDKVVKIDYELRNISKEHSDYQFAAKRVLNLLAQNRCEQAQKTIKKIEKIYCLDEQENPLGNLILAIESFIQDSTNRAQKNKQTAFIGMLLFSASILIFGLGAGILISHGISKPLQLAVNIANRIAAGDRDITITTTAKDETGQLLKTMKEMSSSVKQSEVALESSNKNLEDSNKKLNQSNQQLQDFTYVASHDLREPLRKISAFGQLLVASLGEKLEDDDRENLDFMIDGAERMQQMIEALLTYSRVSTKGQLVEVIDSNELVKQLKEIELSVLIEEKNVTLEIPKELPPVKADPVQIRQLLQNLIANGIKYQKKDSTPCITITSRPAADGMVRIEVADNGIGVKPEYQSAVFEMFRRLHAKNEYEGTGIGLTVCKKIVERHGGQIGVESQPGQGSTFWFTLPQAQRNHEDDELLQSGQTRNHTSA